MSSIISGTKQMVITLLVLLTHCTIIVVEHYLQNVSSIVPPYMHHLCQHTPSIVAFSRAHDLVGRDNLHDNNKVTEFHIPVQLVMSIKICINDGCNKITVGQHLSDTFPIQKNSKNLVFNCALRYANYDSQSTLQGIFWNRVLVPHSRVKATPCRRRMKTLPPVCLRRFCTNITQPSYKRPARQRCL